jgi:pantothenate kinase
MTNKVITAIDKMNKQIIERQKSGLVSAEQVKALGEKLNMAIDEYVSFQELKSLASVSGKLSLDEANTIYGYLGNSVEHFNEQSVVVKVVLTKIFSELLTWKMALRAA